MSQSGTIKYNIYINQGATFIFSGTMTESDGTTAIDLTGTSFRGSLRTNHSDSSAAATFNGSIVSATAGTFQLSLSAAVTAALSVDASSDCQRNLTCFLYDFEWVKADSTVDRIMEGIAYLSPEVTY